jgi:hypothetical protein
MQNPIPGLSALIGPNSTADSPGNMNALLRWAKTISPRILAADATAGESSNAALYCPAGTAPPSCPSDAYLLIAGDQAVTFSAGAGLITLPQSFPNGILSAWVGPDSGADLGVWVAVDSPAFTALNQLPVYGYGYSGSGTLVGDATNAAAFSSAAATYLTDAATAGGVSGPDNVTAFNAASSAFSSLAAVMTDLATFFSEPLTPHEGLTSVIYGVIGW